MAGTTGGTARDRREEIGELWAALSREMRTRFRRAFQGQEHQPGAIALLREIDRRPGATVGELGRRTGLVKSQVSRTVDQLVAHGLAEKRPDPRDQRLVRVHPTGSAAGGRQAMEAHFRALWAEVIETVPEEKLAEVEGSIRVLLEAIERVNRRAGDGEPGGACPAGHDRGAGPAGQDRGGQEEVA